jgi:tRNA A-37 threonylcarbamoyl transferase component Bud32
VHWLAGDESRRASLLDAVERLARGEGVTWLRTREGRRRLARVHLAEGGNVFAKHYLHSTRHRLREWWKRRLHLTTAEREWRTLRSLHAAGIPVPEPRARGRLETGESVVLTAWIGGAPLGEALPEAAATRHRLIAEAGALVRRLHAAGWVHRDLHRENLFVDDRGLYLIDLQAARRFSGAAGRRSDLGRLDFSLRDALSLADRVRLRAAALGVARPFDARARQALREVGHASLERGRIHAASRARRSLREGRLYRRFEAGGMRGLVARETDEAALRAAVAAPDASPTLEVRRYAEGLASWWRGSEARRAWGVAHALQASDIACLRPIAFLERPGWSGASLLVLEREPAVESRPDRERVEKLDAQLAEAGFTAALGADDVVVRDGRAVVAALERVSFGAWPPGPGRARPRA